MVNSGQKKIIFGLRVFDWLKQQKKAQKLQEKHFRDASTMISKKNQTEYKK